VIRIQRLAGHDRSRFDCGVDELNNWLRTQATQQQRKDNTVTFVALNPDDGRVVGYYSSLTYRLDLDEAADAFGIGARRYPVPAILLARLAVCRSAQGERIGEQLLVHAFRSAMEVAARVGVEVVIVHAISDSAVEFYEHYGFARFIDLDRSLFMTMRSIRALLG
jgi:GNAT superfamily N-acetyltransferase